jgi:hypothetical protein
LESREERACLLASLRVSELEVASRTGTAVACRTWSTVRQPALHS